MKTIHWLSLALVAGVSIAGIALFVPNRSDNDATDWKQAMADGQVIRLKERIGEPLVPGTNQDETPAVEEFRIPPTPENLPPPALSNAAVEK